MGRLLICTIFFQSAFNVGFYFWWKLARADSFFSLYVGRLLVSQDWFGYLRSPKAKHTMYSYVVINRKQRNDLNSVFENVL